MQDDDGSGRPGRRSGQMAWPPSDRKEGKVSDEPYGKERIYMAELSVIERCVIGITRIGCYYRILRAIALIILFALVIPLLIGYIFAVPLSTVFALISATFALQAAADIVGIGLSVDPLVLLAITTSVALAVIIGILEICDLFAQSSARVAGWLSQVEKKIENYTVLKKYGAFMLIPIIWIPGIALYGSPLIAWIFQWNRLLSITCMLIGWLIASVLVILVSLGFHRLFIPL
jgi:uncharacterized membrane protein